MILPAVALACLLLVADEVDTNRSPTQLYDPGNIVDDQGVVRHRLRCTMNPVPFPQ